MALSAPPSEPPTPALIATCDDGRLRRLQFHLWQLMLTVITLATTVYVCLIGIPLISIIAVGVAKHVLVAILIMGLKEYP